jgi:hypothetical protein
MARRKDGNALNSYMETGSGLTPPAELVPRGKLASFRKIHRMLCPIVIFEIRIAPEAQRLRNAAINPRAPESTFQESSSTGTAATSRSCRSHCGHRQRTRFFADAIRSGPQASAFFLLPLS